MAVDVAAGKSYSTPASSSDGYPPSTLRLDVFTQIPHAFGWLTEQKPVATVLGGELELRLLNYRETTPLRAGQVDDEPYGGGAGNGAAGRCRRRGTRAVYGDDRPAA